MASGMERVFYDPDRLMWSDVENAREATRKTARDVRSARVKALLVVLAAAGVAVLPHGVPFAIAIALAGGALMAWDVSRTRARYDRQIETRKEWIRDGHVAAAKKNKRVDAARGM